MFLVTHTAPNVTAILPNCLWYSYNAGYAKMSLGYILPTLTTMEIKLKKGTVVDAI